MPNSPFSNKLLLLSSLMLLTALPVHAAPVTYLYEITSGTYTEVGGIWGVLTSNLPTCGQAFIELTINHELNTADMRILSDDIEPFGFFGFGSPFINGSVNGNEIRFRDATLVSKFGAPGRLDYVVSLRDDLLSLGGCLISEGVCCDIPYEFSHTGVEASVPDQATTTLSWGAEKRLTHDDLSDSAPAVVVHNDGLHVLWNHSYAGEVHHAILDRDTWMSLGPIADCPTGSGPGAASYFDGLYAFYTQGAYPVYHLLGKNLSDGSAAFALTSGDVYDKYGAASAVYQEKLYVFWKRWDGGSRYILYKTFDGNEWSEASTIVDDEYHDGRPAVAVYDGQLYLFYRAGGRYKVFDGISWSADIMLTACAYRNTTPAACSYGKRLYVFLPHAQKIRYKMFDGTRWGPACTVPTSAPHEVRDVAAAVYRGTLYLLWCSWYSWPSSELHAKVAWLWADLDVDGDVDLEDFAGLADCLTGPGEEVRPGCELFDFEGDEDVDLRDAAAFQTAFTGS